MSEQLRKLVKKICEINFVRLAIEEKADLAEFRERPSLEAVLGMVLVGLGILLGWPAVALLGVLAVQWHDPMLAVVGAPLIYAISHLLFWPGVYFSGAQYGKILLRCLTRVMVEKMVLWVDR